MKLSHGLGNADWLQKNDDVRTNGYKAEYYVENAILGGMNRAPEISYLDYECPNDSFPFKLHIMLSESEEQGQGYIVSWKPHGRW